MLRCEHPSSPILFSSKYYYILYLGLLSLDWGIVLCSDVSIHRRLCEVTLNIYDIIYLGLFVWLSDSLSTLVIGFPFLNIFSSISSFFPTVASHPWILHTLRKHVVNAPWKLSNLLDSFIGACVLFYIDCRRFPLRQSLSCAVLLFILLHRIIHWILCYPLHKGHIHSVKQCILLHFCTVLLPNTYA